MIVVLLASTGAAWEGQALAALQAHPGVVVLRRCVDVDDLLAAASTGQADVAVVGTDLPGLDRGVLDDLARYDVRAVAMMAPADRARGAAVRTGLSVTLDVDRVAELPDLLLSLPAVDEEPEAYPPPPAAAAPVPPVPVGVDPDLSPPTAAPGRVIAFWGPTGAPGRTTVACAVAAELARRDLSTLLIDADPWGGAVAQQLGVLDEVSGLLAAARIAGAPDLAARFPGTQRRLSDRLRVLTGLPRADRWSEVRPGVLGELIDLARTQGQVVLDTGFTLEQDLANELGRPGRNDLTREALEAADEVVVVGSADPVGLTRLVRALDEVREIAPRPLVVVNRMRPTLGWRESDVAAMVDGFGAESGGAVGGVVFLPDDQAAVDRAMVAGRLLVEVGDSALQRGVAALVETLASRSAYVGSRGPHTT